MADLIHPLSLGDFIDRHWIPGRPYLGRVADDLVGTLLEADGLGGPAELVARHRRKVRTFGPNGERAMVSPDEGLAHYEDGHTLYLDFVHRTLPEVHRCFAGAAADLGLAPWQITLEAFAGRAGSVSTRHFDHDVTIQVLLQGEKQWLFESNDLVNPLHAYHPPVDPDDHLADLSEEAYRPRPSNVEVERPEVIELRAHPASAVFLSRGWWHQTRSLTDTWSFNVVFHSVSWARAFSRALEVRLHADPLLRTYCPGFVDPPRPLTTSERSQRSDTMARLHEAASRAVAEISPEEVSLAMLSFLGRMYRWSDRAADRRLDTGDGPTVVVFDGDHCVPVPEGAERLAGALLTIGSNIRWEAVPALDPEVPAERAWTLISQLLDDGALQTVHPGLGG